MIVKCQYCGLRDTHREDMYDSKKKGVRYYHHECWEKYKVIKESKEQDSREKDMINDTLKRIYGYEFIPKPLWEKLSDYRAGTARLKGKKGKEVRQKKGIRYYIINDAYLLAEKEITNSLSSRHFEDSIHALFYGMRIMEKKINDAYLNEVKKKKMNKEIEYKMNALENEDNNDMNVDGVREQPKFNKKENINDISQFLDD